MITGSLGQLVFVVKAGQGNICANEASQARTP